MITGTVQGEIYQVNREGSLVITPDERWPDNAAVCHQLTSLANIAFNARCAKKSRSTKSKTDNRNFSFVAQPLMSDDTVTAVVVFKLTPRSEIQLRAVMQLVHWGVFWLSAIGSQEPQSGSKKSMIAVDFLKILARATDLREAVVDLCDALSEYFRFERVSIGVRRGRSTRIVGITQNVNLARNSSLQQDLEAAMTEACDFQKPVLYPDPEVSALCHKALARRQGMNVIYTHPLMSESETYGAITLERTNGHALSSTERAELAVLSPLLGHQLQLMVQHEYSPGQRCVRIVKRVSSSRIVCLGIALIITALCLLPATYEVDSNATVEGTVQRAIVAPVDGYISDALVRAGDTVAKDAVLARLEDRDLTLERKKWQSEYERNSKTYVEALATQQRAQSRIAEARMSETEAELNLVDERLNRTTLQAPFAGVVVSGDFSQSLGTPVARGQVIYEIAPLDSYHVVSEVLERDITNITLGQQGQLRLVGMPDQLFDITVFRIAPMAKSDNGRTYFQVESRVSSDDARIRPGMQGISKLIVGKRPYLWIWTHRLSVKLRLWLWSLGV